MDFQDMQAKYKHTHFIHKSLHSHVRTHCLGLPAAILCDKWSLDILRDKTAPNSFKPSTSPNNYKNDKISARPHMNYR